MVYYENTFFHYYFFKFFDVAYVSEVLMHNIFKLKMLGFLINDYV